MATTSSPEDRVLDSEGHHRQYPFQVQQAPPKRSPWPGRLAIAAALVAILSGAGWWAVWYARSRGPGVNRNMKTAQVRLGDLAVTVSEEGNLESAVNIDIKCEVAGGTAILSIVEDGQQVKKGDKLVELDSSALEEQINQQRITYEKARAAVIQAEKDFAAAKIAVDEYLEGTFVKDAQALASQITVAEENLRSAQNALDHSERMFRKGYISALDLESQKFSVERAQLELDSARTAEQVLVKFTKEKVLQELESKRDSAEARVKSEQASYELEESRLQRLETQLTKCVIQAPADGMVVFANERDHHGMSQQPQIEEGAMVRERQTILQLPDLAQMQVRVNVHESKVEALERALDLAEETGVSLPARIEILGRQLPGRLASIANQPAPSDFRTGNVKQYATIVAIDGTPEGLRPGMTAKCEVVVQKLTDVLMIPVTAVVEQRNEYLCWVSTKDGVERRLLTLGTRNEQVVEVKDGVRQGELVVVNPRAVIPDARGLHEDHGPQPPERRFAITEDDLARTSAGPTSEPEAKPAE